MTYIPGIAPGSLTSAGASQASDLIVVTRAGAELSSTPALQAAYTRKTPAGSRSLALTGSNTVQLTQTDHDKTIIFTGTTGTLSTDGSLVDGFYCRLMNNASGSLTWGSGLSGWASSTALSSAGRGAVEMVGATIWASLGTTGTLTTATAYTGALSATHGAAGATVTYTVTPTGGVWPAGDVITPTLTGTLTGTWSPTTSGALSANSTPIVFTLTPTSAAGTSGTITSSATTTTGGALTNSTGAISYAIDVAAATSFTTAPTTVSTPTTVATNLTSTPNGAWQSGQTYTLTPATVAGTFAAVSGCTVSGTTVTPTAGGSAAAVVSFTPSSANGTSGTIAIAGTSITATTTSIAVSVRIALPAITTGGASRVVVYESDIGITGSAPITAVADQSGNANASLASTVGATVGASVNGHPSISFGGATYAANSGLTANSATWLNSLRAPSTIMFAFKTPATVDTSQMWVFNPTQAQPSTNDMQMWLNAGTGFVFNWRAATGTTWNAAIPSGPVPAANTLYKFMIRRGATEIDIWINGTKFVVATGTFNDITASWAAFNIGQNVTGGTQFGQTNDLFLGFHAISGALSDTDIGTYNTYMTSMWG